MSGLDCCATTVRSSVSGERGVHGRASGSTVRNYPNTKQLKRIFANSLKVCGLLPDDPASDLRASKKAKRHLGPWFSRACTVALL